MTKVNAYAAFEAGKNLESFSYTLDAIGPDEVDLEVISCGICHSDLNMIDNDWRVSQYPVVPGHEIVGKVIAKGDFVKHLEIGQVVGIGWIAGSCHHCDQCVKGDHNLCSQISSTIVGRHGGFADKVRVEALWAFPIPSNLDPISVGPLMCGGITVFNPILQNRISPLSRVGVVGIGGLGHMALGFLKAWGCEVTAFSTSPEKEEEARNLGAHHFVPTHDADALQKIRGSLDMVLDTVNADLDWNAYLSTLKPKGVLHIVGVANEITARVGSLLGKQRSISASPTGSPASIRNMLDFAARHQIAPKVEVYDMSSVNEAIDRVRNGKPKFRVVLKA